MKKLLIWGVILTALGVGTWLAWRSIRRYNEKPILFRTETVRTADLVRTIDSTGTVEPEELINIGAQVAGQIIQFGTDCDGKTVDYGSRVAAGTVLARIDDDLYQADLKQAGGALRQARAQILKAESELRQLRIQADLARSDFDRAEKLIERQAIAPNIHDSLRAACEGALVNEKTGEAALELAHGNFEQCEAALERATRNVAYCTITSPVDGVIIDRRVNVGQTVVSSMSAPSLFLLAKDLSRIQIWVAVNEADIGMVAPGMKVEFSIDAYPGVKFTGEVGKIRLNAALTQNVVTYTVEINTANPDGKLLPYMTANVRFLLEERRQVASLTNAALRWQPPLELVDSEFRHILDLPPPAAGEEGYIWVLEATGLMPHQVRLGISDGVRTEIVAGMPGPEVEIVSGILTENAAKKSRVSPFLPQARQRI